MSLHGGLRISHHALNNVHQNELEINSLDVDSPHYSWQIGPRLKSCALTVAPPLDVSVAFGIATIDLLCGRKTPNCLRSTDSVHHGVARVMTLICANRSTLLLRNMC